MLTVLFTSPLAMYRVVDLLRAGGQRTTRARQSTRLPGAIVRLASSQASESALPAASSASAPTTAAAAPPKPRRRISDLGSPAAIDAAEAARVKKATRAAERAQRAANKTAGFDGAHPTDVPVWQWRKQARGLKWSHLRDGIFPLAEATAAGAAAPMSLLHGVSSSASNLFEGRATIHRIIGFESDLILEARRDNTKSAEVALVGRSNVGKSSLLNTLLKNGGLRKQLATVSKTPGRTQQLFMFSFEDDRNCRIVDWSHEAAEGRKEQQQPNYSSHLTLFVCVCAAQSRLRLC